MRRVPQREDHPLRLLWRTRALGASCSEVIWNGSRPKFKKVGKKPDGTDKWKWDGEETWLNRWEYITKRVEKEPMTEEGEEGLAFEAQMRKQWEVHSNGFVGEACDVIDDEYDFLRAQIDCLSFDGRRAVDFKLVRGQHKKKGIAAMKNSNCIVEGDPWWINAQHQLRVLGFDWMDYYILIDGIEEKHFIVRRNQAFINDYVARCQDFWLYVEKDSAPPNRKLKLVKDTPVEQEGRK